MPKKSNLIEEIFNAARTSKKTIAEVAAERIKAAVEEMDKAPPTLEAQIKRARRMTNATTHTTAKEALNQKPAPAACKHLPVLENYLNAVVLDQGAAVRAVLVGIVSGQHVCLIGPPGEAKTMLATHAADAFGVNTFNRLLSRFSTPDEVLGAVSIKALKNDKIQRNMQGMAPDCEVVILDEIFKANSPMLNALLGLLNERIVDGVQAKTLACIGLSNEYPRDLSDGSKTSRSGQAAESLRPLWDRFGLRVEVVQPESEATLRHVLCGTRPAPIPAIPKLQAGDLQQMQQHCAQMADNLPAGIVDAILDAYTELKAEGVQVSTRRLRKAGVLVCANALVSGRSVPQRSDLQVLRHALWNTPEQRKACEDAVASSGDPSIAAAMELEGTVSQKWAEYKKANCKPNIALRMEILERIKEAGEECRQLLDSCEASSKDEIARCVAQIRSIYAKMRAEVMGDMADF